MHLRNFPISKQVGLNTLCVHSAHTPEPATGALSQPIYLATTFERDADGGYPRGYRYSREGTPNRTSLEECIAALEGGRHGLALTRFGPINIKTAHHAEDPRPLEPESRCAAARDFSRAYLHHLFRSGETLGGTLLSIVNLFYYQDLMAGARRAIGEGRLRAFVDETRRAWTEGEAEGA